jgi:hypothetical protein
MFVTYYPHTFAARSPQGIDVPWQALAGDLARFRLVAGDKQRRLDRCPLWSPVRLSEPRRVARNVVDVTALVLDYDDDAALPLPEAMGKWNGLARAGYTTWSHTEEAPRCRVVLPLAKPVPGVWWSLLYRDILQAQGKGADRACSDPSRAYYVPAEGAGGPHSALQASGELLDLYEHAESLNDAQGRKRARQEEERRQRAEAARAKAQQSHTDYSTAERTARKLYRSDPDARRRAADLVGAVVVTSGAEELARKAPCPDCRRDDVWWPLVPRGAGWVQCNHRDSCGYAASLFDYLEAMT